MAMLNNQMVAKKNTSLHLDDSLGISIQGSVFCPDFFGDYNSDIFQIANKKSYECQHKIYYLDIIQIYFYICCEIYSDIYQPLS